MVKPGQSEFKYFAFISYSRKDSRVAAFLHRRLEKFRIPVKRVPQEFRRGLGKFVRPVFRDKRDLEVGENSFTEDVKKALKEARFIIVLCSQNSAQSVWVNNEIKYFLDTHSYDLTKVVPVVLSGDPGSGDVKTECLCECLLSEKIKPVIVKRNLPTMIPDEGENERFGWEAGVVGVLSYMLKVKRQDIKATIDAEKVRQMRIYAAIGIVCSTIFAGLAFWAVRAEQTAKQNWQLAEENKRQAIEQRDRAMEAERLADANRRKAEENEKRAVAEEKTAKEKAFLAEKTVDFLKRMLQEARPDEHGAKNVIDLLAEQQSKVDLLQPPELRYSVSLTLGQIMLEQSLAVPASRMLKYAYDFCRSNGKTDELIGAANLLAVAYNEMSGHSEAALTFLSEVEQLKRSAGESNISIASTAFNMAASYFVKGDFVRSQELCGKALALTGGKPCQTALLALGQSVRIANELGDLECAEKHYERLLQMCEALKEEPCTDAVEAYVVTCYRQGKYEKAKNIAEETLAKAKAVGSRTRSIALLENDLGLIKVELGDIQGAIVNYRNAIDASKKLWPDGHAFIANEYSNLGVAYLTAGGPHRALPMFRRAVEMIEKVDGRDSYNLYMPLVNLGLAYKRTGERDKALAAYERAYRICVMKHGPDNVHLALVMDHLAGTRREQGKNEEAKAGFEKVLEILTANNRLDSSTALSAMGSLAELQSLNGETGKAGTTISNAMEIARRILPPGNDLRNSIMRTYEKVSRATAHSQNGSAPELETSWNAKKSEALKALKERRDEEAQKLYQELMLHLERTGQTFTHEYAMFCNQLGVLAGRRGDLTSALLLYSKSRDIHFSISGTNDMEVAVPCYNVAVMLKKLGDLDGAEEACMRALPAYEAVADSTLSDIYTTLGRIKRSQKKLPDALEWYRKALAFDVSSKGTNSVAVAIDHEDIGDSQKEAGDYAASTESYQSAIDIRKGLGEDEKSEKMGHLANELGNALWKSKRYSEAAAAYRRAYEIDLELLGLTNRNTVVVLGNLGDSERMMGDYTNAIEHLTLAADLKKSMKEFDLHDYGQAMNDLAIAYSGSGDSYAALRTFAVSVEHYIRALGREDSNVMTVYANMALECKNHGKVADAVGYYRKALDISLLLYGEKNETTREYYRDLGDCLYAAEKYDKCAAIRKKYLGIVCKDENLNPCFTAKAHNLYAEAIDALDDYEGAISNRVLAVEKYRICGKEFQESVAVSLCLLGKSLRHAGDFKSAADAYSEAKRLCDANHFKYKKGDVLDSGIHQELEECRELVAGRLVLVVKINKITTGGQAERLGVREGDIWCSLDEWKESNYPGGKGLWSSVVKQMEDFNDKKSTLTVCRMENGRWTKKSFRFGGGAGGFVYGYGVIPAADYYAIKSALP